MDNQRVIVYVDGFNLYFGMMEEGYSDCRWLDVRKLANALLLPNQTLEGVNFFTSFIANDAKKEKRQRTYIDALIAKDVRIIPGKYERKEVVCEVCSNVRFRTNEKMTDVNIAVNLIMDAVNDKFDAAILISGDSDLVPAISTVRENFTGKKIIDAFPPARQNQSVKKAAHGWIQISHAKPRQNQLETQVMSSRGFVLIKPENWNL